jgi:cell wall-associated NlpC family hydrolase
VFEPEPVAVAERFLAAPYQWGGRESLGLDCSALVQQALYACGRGCPRDSDMQEAALGRDIPRGELRRGDLVFWDGHVAWMIDGRRVLHANAHDMAVVVEPLSEAITRCAPRTAASRRRTAGCS